MRKGSWWTVLERIGQDTRHAARLLVRRPSYAAVSVVTLALAIGATTALFSVVNGVLVQPLPYPEPDRLMALYQATPNLERGSISYPNFLDWQRDNRTFTSLAAYFETGFSIAGDRSERAERAEGERVSAGFFRLFGVKALLGRVFEPEDDHLGAAPVVLIAEGLWKRKFGSARDILGKRIRVNGNTSTIVGVIPVSFHFAVQDFGRRNEIYLPIGQWSYAGFRDRSSALGMNAIGRLKAGVTLPQARSDMEAVARHLAALFPESDQATSVAMVPLRNAIVGDVQSLLLTLFGAVMFVLLIACVNVASLQLVHSAARTQEFAIRAALGASPGRLLNQMLTESILLAVTGGCVGILLAKWGTQFCLSLFPSGVPRSEEVGLDGRVLAFTLATSVLSGLAFGLAPALMTRKLALQNSLRERGRGLNVARRRAQAVFVVAELALALSLLIGAGLVLRSLANVWKVDPGFDTHNVISLSIGLRPGMDSQSPDTVRAIYRELHEKLQSMPGVDSVSFSWGSLPIAWSSEAMFWVEGKPKPARDDQMNLAQEYVVEPGYFPAMGIRLQRGRVFGRQDQEHSQQVAVVDDRFARKYFPREDPIGKHITLNNGTPMREIVGIVGHVKQWGLGRDETYPLQAQLYYPFMQMRDDFMQQSARAVDVIMRTREAPATVMNAIRRTVQQMDSDQVVFGGVSMDHVIQDSLAPQRFASILLSGFAAVAMLLAGIGVYGLFSYTVTQRAHEFGIRMALGEQRAHVLRHILAYGARMAMIGIVIGFAGAFALTRVLRGMLFGVSPTDPGVFTALGVLLIAIALLACYLPARRATRVDPVIALRSE